MHIKRSRFAEKKSQNPFEWKHFQDYLQARKLSVLFLYIISFAVYGIWASHDVISLLTSNKTCNYRKTARNTTAQKP